MSTRSSSSPKTLATLPPDVLTKIISFVPVSELGKVASLSRRFKILTYSDGVYIPKLKWLGYYSSTSEMVEKTLSKKLASTLKMLPGAHLLPNNAEYLKTGSFFGANGDSNLIPGSNGNDAENAEGSETVVKPRVLFMKEFTELIPFYLDFSEKHSLDSKLFKEVNQLEDIASMLKRLQKFGTCRFIPNFEKININVQTTLEYFESSLLTAFEKAYDANDTNEMHKNAVALYHLNGGHACSQLFISKNSIFFDETHNPTLLASKIPSLLQSPQAIGTVLSEDFGKYMSHMLESCRHQADIISKVFPPEMDVLYQFIHRIFEESIADYLNAVLEQAGKQDTMTYVTTLATAVYQCTQFLDFLNSTGSMPVEFDKIRDTVSEICTPYAHGYIDMEMDQLKADYKKKMEKFIASRATHKNVEPVSKSGANNRTRNKREALNAVKAVINTPSAATKSYGSKSKVAPLKEPLLHNPDGFGTSALSPTTPVEAPKLQSSTSEKDLVNFHLDDENMTSLLSLELCLSLIHVNKEAMRRCLIITAATKKDEKELERNASKIFVHMLKTIGEQHTKPALATAMERLSVKEGSMKNEAMQFFELINVGDLIIQMVDLYYQEMVAPYIDASDFLSDISVEKKAFERVLDDMVASGMDKAINSLMSLVELTLMQEQALTDFNPPENKVMDLKPSKACLKVIDCLESHTRVLTGTGDKHILEIFFQEIGIRFFSVICKHLKRFQISQQGGLQLICDLNKYYEWASDLRNGTLSRLFAVVKELGNVYIVETPQDLKELINDHNRFQGQLRVEELYELLASRTDYKQIQKGLDNKDCCIQ